MFEDTEQDSENEIGLGEVSEGGLGVKRIILTETGTLVDVPHEQPYAIGWLELCFKS